MGNLRTALAAWAWARTTGRRFLLRVEDIDPHRTGADREQIRDLEALGIDWDEPPLYQSERLTVYDRALEELAEGGHLFECYCSRKDIREAANAPHTQPGHYPGTCLDLTEMQRRAAREKLAAAGRVPALRLRPQVRTWQVWDQIHGTFTGPVDAFVLRRSDGGPAYNLAVVVDDALSGVDQVVRGDDLLASAPGQAYLASLLGAATPVYGHVPLVLGPSGNRLAKRDGAVTLTDLRRLGWSAEDVLTSLTGSLGTGPVGSVERFLVEFDPARIPRVPFQFTADTGLRPH